MRQHSAGGSGSGMCFWLRGSARIEPEGRYSRKTGIRELSSVHDGETGIAMNEPREQSEKSRRFSRENIMFSYFRKIKS